MTREEVVKALGPLLVENGFRGHGRHFRMSEVELDWLLQLEMVPNTDRVAIYVGVSPHLLVSGTAPSKANDCPIVLHPESGGEPFGLDHWDMWQSLSMDSGLADDDRLDHLGNLVEAVAAVVRQATTTADLRRMAADGQLRGFVREDARALLFE